jgi:hypothetical protein
MKRFDIDFSLAYADGRKVRDSMEVNIKKEYEDVITADGLAVSEELKIFIDQVAELSGAEQAEIIQVKELVQ